MKIEIIGGGPGGLYLAILTKKARPDWQVAVHEQNREGDTFGFGVVFSDDTLDEFLSRDPESYAMIRDRFAYWDDIRIVRSGTEVRCGGNGFAGCARLALLEVLFARCRQLGVALSFGEVIDPAELSTRFADADVIVASDGINSRIRTHFAQAFQPEVRLMANQFTWMGSTRPLTDFTYFFRETPHGIITAHTYQYEPGRSTWIFETDPATWAGHGFAGMGEDEAARYLEGVFADELQGHGLITNRSLWRNFPRVECKAWSHGNIVLLGDAKATAHYSIGSGTKLAMECAIALADALLAHEHDVGAAFAAYEAARRTPVEITQHNAAVSLAWFEHVRRSWDMPVMQFANVVMSRAKAITYDNLLLRDPDFVDAVDSEFYDTLLAETGHDARDSRPTPMFTPLTLRGLTLANRVVVSPMAQYRAVAGEFTDWHLMHYGARAQGGAGLVYLEMTCPSADARITLGCPGLWNDAQEASLKRIIDFAHADGGARIALQLGHAGRKGSTQLGWEKMDHPIARAEDNWPLVSASPIAWFEGESQVPAELDEAGMARITADFVGATERAARAGVDLLELHCAHGYLLASFLSPLTNLRTDGYGGAIENRLRFPLELFRAMRAVWPEERPMAVRISASDWAEGGLSEADCFAIARGFADAGVDLIDVSSGQTVPHQAPTYGRMYQVPFAESLKNELGVKTICVGAITEPGQVNTIIACRRADLVAVGRPHLTHPNWTMHAAAWYGTKRGLAVPKPYLSGAAQLWRETERTREKQAELQRKAKPKRHHTERTLAFKTGVQRAAAE
ncbi:anthraniloyl-CoA monooxygenase [Polymorphobacter multimanifer]|uniref:Anthraniloyl-CoA monooxygenase n=1 Tax=Polymorphobacter multimanifer TaxID=1070431 RepID=A0A841L5M9_9SPHN|nr:FAD-dependent monooxygenase [Polymorphobacter multimanifer]MBB6227904.1 anthraniloyl-CoA monooxygenase [Polymorphobacter multimanifer]